MKKEKWFSVLLFITIMTFSVVVVFRFILVPDYPIRVIYQLPASSTSEPIAQESLSQASPGGEPEQETAEDDPRNEIEWQEDEGELGPFTEALPAEKTQSFPLELNTATASQLMQIPRIGEVTAARILAYREELGGYTALSQLQDIKGIGPATYNTIVAYLYLAGDEWDRART